MAGTTVQAGQPLTLTADQAAAALGLTLPDGMVWEFDTEKSTVPAGITLGWNSLTGTIDPDQDGAYALQVFYASDGAYHQMTPYPIHVLAAPAAPTGQDVADFLGQGENPTLVALADEAVPVVTAMARAYTRDRGFTDNTPASDVAAVITTATARLVANPEQLRHTVGGVQQHDGFTGWSLAETFVLNRYRKRAL